jgi:general stress protein YciG
METKGRKSRCKARTKAGKPCQAAATTGGLCFFHANPNKASELGRIGGRSKRPSASETADPLPKLETAIAVRDAVARLIKEVYAGKLDPRVAAGLAPLLSLQKRLIETTDLERRLAKLEKLLAETEAEKDLDRKQDSAPLEGLADMVAHGRKRYERAGTLGLEKDEAAAVDSPEAT